MLTYQGGDSVIKPYLYQLSAYQSKCEKVVVQGRSVTLPIDSSSNQFAIVRPMDPAKSRQISFLDNFMVAIMKEIHIKPDDANDSIDFLDQ